MNGSFFQRATAWLCFALVLLVGATSARGFVLCFEADGCVSLELKAADASCGGCEGHGEDEPAPQELPSASATPDCPCIDLSVPGSDERVATTRSIAVHVGPWICAMPDLRVDSAASAAIAQRGPPDAVPRVAGAWAHIRCVVLLV